MLCIVILMLHLILVFAAGDMLHDKLIRCHRTGLIRATTFAWWAGLDSVYRWASLMRITKEGRLCAVVAFGRVNGDSLESQVVLGSRPKRGQFCHKVAVGQ